MLNFAADFEAVNGSIFGTPLQLGVAVYGDNTGESKFFRPEYGYTVCAPKYYRITAPRNGTYRISAVGARELVLYSFDLLYSTDDE